MTGGTRLHALFHLRNQHAFHKLLEASTSSQGQPSSGGRSLNSKPNPLSSSASGSCTEPVEVNARDSLGRTVLHLAATASDAAATEYVRMLLAHPSINPNLQDYESHWTALHRALYAGNIGSALLLLQRGDVDTKLKDLEGYRAFDLYNSTVHGTKPKSSTRMDLFTWGANRNAALGLGDGDDRMYPDQVVVERVPKVAEGDPLDARFEPVRVHQVVMSKLHTALALGQDHTLALTSSGEVYSWGLNRFHQLGYVVDPPSSIANLPRHQQEEVTIIQNTPRKVAAPALKGKFVTGIAACRSASVCWSWDEVWTWGTNGGQLGYDKSAHPVQILPRKVTKIIAPVLQISITENAMACLLESHDVVCIHNDSTFRINFPTQTFPSSMPTYRPPQAVRNASIKKITSSPGGEGFVALSENGELFLCMLSGGGQQQSGQGSGRDGQVKVQRVWALRKQFSAVKDVEMGADGTIIICTESGHVFIRSRNPNLITSSSTLTTNTNVVNPPINNNPNASLLSSTNPGAKAMKFQRVPFIQRVVRVCANSLGAFGALRVDADPSASDRGHAGKGLEVTGDLVQQSLKGVRSWLAFGNSDVRGRSGGIFLGRSRPPTDENVTVGFEKSEVVGQKGDISHARVHRDADEEEDEAVVRDILELQKLCEVLERHKLAKQDPDTLTPTSAQLFSTHTSTSHGEWFDPKMLPAPSTTAFGADLLIEVDSFKFPAHRMPLAARSETLRSLLDRDVEINDKNKEGKRIRVKLVNDPSPNGKSGRVRPKTAPWHNQSRLSISGVHPLTVLIFLTYIYTDELLTYWDPRVAPQVSASLSSIGMSVQPDQIRAELQHLAKLVGPNEVLTQALVGNVKRSLEARLATDLVGLSSSLVQDGTPSYHSALAPDVILVMADKQVPCHSVILRARSSFFSAFFDEEEWTKERWTEDGVIRVDLRHLEWKVGRFVVWYLHGGDMEMFDRLEFVNTTDELVEFMFEVMAAANELLLDRLVLLCSSVILKRVNISNACTILADATHLHALPLIRRIQRYIAINLETLLESHMLDDLPFDLIKQLSIFVRREQETKSPVSRTGRLVKQAMETYKDWLALQDIPVPILRTHRVGGDGGNAGSKHAAKLSPPGVGGKKKDKLGSGLLLTTMTATSSPPSPVVRPQFEAKVSQVASSGAVAEGEMFLMDDGVPALALEQQSNGSASGTTKVPGWRVLNAPKTDMKSIMAEAETSKLPPTTVVRPSPSIPSTPSRPPSTPIVKPTDSTNWRTPQKPTRLASETLTVPVRAPSTTGSPWKLPPTTGSTTTPAIASKPDGTSTPTKPTQAQIQTPPTTPVKRKEGVGVAVTPGTAPGMGPVFAPKKGNSPSKKTTTNSSPGFRRVSSGGSAWTLPPVQPIVQPSISQGTPMSFVAIQQLQLEQDMLPVKDKRTLVQIQEEERAKQVEDDFLKWWAAEEEKMKVEQRVGVVPEMSDRLRPMRGGTGKDRNRDRERGGGGGGGAGGGGSGEGSDGRRKPKGKPQGQQSGKKTESHEATDGGGAASLPGGSGVGLSADGSSGTGKGGLPSHGGGAGGGGKQRSKGGPRNGPSSQVQVRVDNLKDTSSLEKGRK